MRNENVWIFYSKNLHLVLIDTVTLIYEHHPCLMDTDIDTKITTGNATSISSDIKKAQICIWPIQITTIVYCVTVTSCGGKRNAWSLTDFVNKLLEAGSFKYSWEEKKQVCRRNGGKGRQTEQHGTISDRQCKAEWLAGRADVSMIQQYSGSGKMMKGLGGGWWRW